MNVRLPTLLLTALLVTVGAPSQAAPPDRHHLGSFGGPGFDGEEFQGRRLARLAEELELTDQQIDNIRAVFESVREERRGEWEEERALRAELRQVTMAEPFDADQAQALAERVGALAAERAFVRSSTFAQALAVLSTEQRAELQTLMEERRDRWRERHARRRAGE